MRYTTVAIVLAAQFLASAQVQPQVITLKPVSAARPLPDRILGANVILFYERVMEDPAKIALLKTMKIGTARFPGGTDSQFWQPETGKFQVPLYPAASFYRKFWAGIAPRLNGLHPQGISVAEASAFLKQIGTSMVLVPNLDTSTPDAQRAWFQSLSARGLVPSRIEMGNESYLAMIGDPASMRRFPDEAHYLGIAKQTLDAVQQYVPRDTKVAVQAAPVGFAEVEGANSRLSARFREWNQELRPQPWFQAVTLHLYARLQTVLGNAGQQNENSIFRAVMGRFDSGVDRVIGGITARVPGKEIWVTEWNPRGGDPSALTATDPRTQGIMMHASVRTVFAFLRHPEVTLSNYFMLNFDGKQAFTVFVKQGQGYRTVPVSEAMSWLNNAANGGSRFTEYTWGAKIPSGGSIPGETYDPVVAGLFENGEASVLILQNATETPFRVQLQQFHAGVPKHVDAMTPPLERQELYAAEVNTLEAADSVLLAPFSLTRVTW